MTGVHNGRHLVERFSSMLEVAVRTGSPLAVALIDVGGVIVTCTISGGVAAYPRSGITMNDLFHSADRSLYAAKKGGRNCVRPDADRVPEQATASRWH